MQNFPELAYLVLGILVGVLACWLVMRAREASLVARLDAATRERDTANERAREIWADRDAMADQFRLLSHESLQLQGRRADEATELGLRSTERMLAPVRQSLDRFNERLADVERERAAQTASLSTQVRDVSRASEELRRETAALSTALRKPQVRGQWGELQLRRVVEVAGMVDHVNFETQSTTVSADDRTIRPDMKVMLSEDRFVYVDSKVPLAAFLDAQECADETARAAKLAQFARNVRTHVDQLGSKTYYKASPGTPEFVVLFLPSEALAAEALTQAPDLYEYAADRNVIIATPSTLIALLRAVSYGWRQAALSTSAAEVFTLGRELYDRLGVLGSHFDKLGRSLNGAVTQYNMALGSLETRVLVTGRRLRDLNVTDAELSTPTGVDAVARGVTAPELVTEPESAMQDSPS